jgi:glycosyltransferase involved in cell wall biosynthesis
MACGCPVLTSEDTARGMNDIRPLTYVSRLDWESLAGQMRAIVDAPAELAARRTAVAEFASRRWDWNQCADEYRRLFAELSGACRKVADRSAIRAFGSRSEPRLWESPKFHG